MNTFHAVNPSSTVAQILPAKVPSAVRSDHRVPAGNVRVFPDADTSSDRLFERPARPAPPSTLYTEFTIPRSLDLMPCRWSLSTAPAWATGRTCHGPPHFQRCWTSATNDPIVLRLLGRRPMTVLHPSIKPKPICPRSSLSRPQREARSRAGRRRAVCGPRRVGWDAGGFRAYDLPARMRFERGVRFDSRPTRPAGLPLTPNRGRPIRLPAVRSPKVASSAKAFDGSPRCRQPAVATAAIAGLVAAGAVGRRGQCVAAKDPFVVCRSTVTAGPI